MRLLRKSVFAAATILGLAVSSHNMARAGDGPPAAQTRAYWSTPGDGTLVLLARTALANNNDYTVNYHKQMGYRIRLCVTNFTGTNSVNVFFWTTAGALAPRPTPNEPETLVLPVGSCAELEHVGGVTVQDATITGAVSGYYELLPETRLPSELTSPTDPKPEIAEHVVIGEAKKFAATCHPLANAPQPPDYSRYCPMTAADIGAGKGVRICVKDKYAMVTPIQGGDAVPGTWAASLISLLSDATLLNKNMNWNYDPRWNPVVPNGCRDIVWKNEDKDKAIYFMLGTYTNLDRTWDPERVTSISGTVQRID